MKILELKQNIFKENEVTAFFHTLNRISHIIGFFTPVTANQLYRELQFLHSYISDAWFWQ